MPELAEVLLDQITASHAAIVTCPALAQVPYEAILGYLRSRGWKKCGHFGAIDYFYQSEGRPEQRQLLAVRCGDSAADIGTTYENTLFINTLASFEGRPALAVLRDLLMLRPDLRAMARQGRAAPVGPGRAEPDAVQVRVEVEWLGACGAIRGAAWGTVETGEVLNALVSGWVARTPCRITVTPVAEAESADG